MSITSRLTTFLSNAKHVMHTSYKPGPEEFSRVAKVIILGILLIGFLGFVISLIVGYITGNSV